MKKISELKKMTKEKRSFVDENNSRMTRKSDENKSEEKPVGTKLVKNEQDVEKLVDNQKVDVSKPASFTSALTMLKSEELVSFFFSREEKI